jgi:putative Mn2+ efflux pump MntP
VPNSDILYIPLIAIGLSADCFAVALGGSISMKRVSRLQVLRVALAFGFFQALMPLIGWLAGRTVADVVAGYDHWVAFLLLALVGGRMTWESFRHKDDGKKIDISRGPLLLGLSIATSIDALAVGLTFAFLKVNIAIASGTIGFIAFAVTATGFFLGVRAGKVAGRLSETIGGVILIGIGLRILLSHLP